MTTTSIPLPADADPSIESQPARLPRLQSLDVLRGMTIAALHRGPCLPVAGGVPLARGPGSAGRQRPTLDEPFVVLGTNAIFAYLGSGLAAKLLHVWTAAASDGTRTSAWGWAQLHVFAPLIPSAPLASLVHSSVYAMLWIAICAWMYRRRIFLKL